MSTDGTDLRPVRGDYARNVVIDSLLLRLMEMCAESEQMVSLLEAVISSAWPEDRLARLRVFRGSNALPEEILAYLITREIVCLAERELAAEAGGQIWRSPLSLRDCGLGGLPEDDLCERPTLVQGIRETEADWKSRLAHMFDRYGEEELQEMFSQQLEFFRQMIEDGWRELYVMANPAEVGNAPVPWIPGLVERILGAIEVAPQTPQLCVQVSTTDYAQRIHIGPAMDPGMPFALFPMRVRVAQIVQVFEDTNDVVWFTKRVEKDIVPGLFIDGFVGEDNVCLEIFGRYCPARNPPAQSALPDKSDGYGAAGLHKGFKISEEFNLTPDPDEDFADDDD